jgi:hypothetical protein
MQKFTSSLVLVVFGFTFKLVNYVAFILQADIPFMLIALSLFLSLSLSLSPALVIMLA